MKILLFGQELGDVRAVEVQAAVACTDDSRPMVVFSQLGDNLASRDISDEAFNETIEMLGLNPEGNPEMWETPDGRRSP